MTVIATKEDSLNVESAISTKGSWAIRLATMTSQNHHRHLLPCITFSLKEGAAAIVACMIATVRMVVSILAANVASIRGLKCTVAVTNQKMISQNHRHLLPQTTFSRKEGAADKSARRMQTVKTEALIHVENADSWKGRKCTIFVTNQKMMMWDAV
jgi:hypothetical protein